MASTTWRDTRPARPSGDYLVIGYKFTDGEAVIDGPLSVRARMAFYAMRIVEVTQDPAPAPEPTSATDEAKPAAAKSKRK